MTHFKYAVKYLPKSVDRCRHMVLGAMGRKIEFLNNRARRGRRRRGKILEPCFEQIFHKTHLKETEETLLLLLVHMLETREVLDALNDKESLVRP